MTTHARNGSLFAAAAIFLGLGLAPAPAGAVTGFQWSRVEPTQEGANLTLAFSGGGGVYGIDLQLQLSDGRTIALPAVTPQAPGELTIPINYKEHGLAPGVTVNNIYGHWQVKGHQWGINGRPSGNPFTLPELPPPPKPGMATFLARAKTLHVNEPKKPSAPRSAAMALALASMNEGGAESTETKPTPSPQHVQPAPSPTVSAPTHAEEGSYGAFLRRRSALLSTPTPVAKQRAPKRTTR